MNLRDYLYFNKITQNAFAKQLDISFQYLSRIINGHHIPGNKLMKRITKETGGSISSSDFPQKPPRKCRYKNLKMLDVRVEDVEKLVKMANRQKAQLKTQGEESEQRT